MSLPYFPFYPDDYEADTAHLNLEEDGAYFRLLRLCWRSPGCRIPADPKWIARKMRVTDAKFRKVIAPIIEEFFVTAAGFVYSERLLKEWQKSDVAHRKRVSAGRKGGKAKSLKKDNSAPSNALAKPKQPEPEPEPSFYPSQKRETLEVGDTRETPFDEPWSPRVVKGGSDV